MKLYVTGPAYEKNREALAGTGAIVSPFFNQDEVMTGPDFDRNKFEGILTNWPTLPRGALAVLDIEYGAFERPWDDFQSEEVAKAKRCGNGWKSAYQWTAYDFPPARYWNDARTDQRPVSEYINEACSPNRIIAPECLFPCLRRPYTFEEQSKANQERWMRRIGSACQKLAGHKPIIPMFDDHVPIRDSSNNIVEIRLLSDEDLIWQVQQVKPWATHIALWAAGIYYSEQTTIEGGMQGENANAEQAIMQTFGPPFDPIARLQHVVAVTQKAMAA